MNNPKRLTNNVITIGFKELYEDKCYIDKNLLKREVLNIKELKEEAYSDVGTILKVGRDSILSKKSSREA